jgi:hypothetical protein
MIMKAVEKRWLQTAFALGGSLFIYSLWLFYVVPSFPDEILLLKPAYFIFTTWLLIGVWTHFIMTITRDSAVPAKLRVSFPDGAQALYKSQVTDKGNTNLNNMRVLEHETLVEHLVRFL